MFMHVSSLSLEPVGTCVLLRRLCSKFCFQTTLRNHGGIPCPSLETRGNHLRANRRRSSFRTTSSCLIKVYAKQAKSALCTWSNGLSIPCLHWGTETTWCRSWGFARGEGGEGEDPPDCGKPARLVRSLGRPRKALWWIGVCSIGGGWTDEQTWGNDITLQVFVDGTGLGVPPAWCLAGRLHHGHPRQSALQRRRPPDHRPDLQHAGMDFLKAAEY